MQARFNAWHLAGVEGNRRGPINRETYQVTAVREDGGLEVTTRAGDGLGERLVLPAGYVAQHLTLAYASTVHAAQGQTVDRSHAVVTSATSPAALYVALSRGRDANTAHVATRSVVDDPARGTDAHSLHRDPVAVLAAILDRSDTAAARSALATAAESAQEAGSVRTAAELLADAAQLAATERTATWLDQLTDARVLTPEQRARIAAENGAASLTRVLRRAELAGHDPRAELHKAITERPFEGARNLTNVIYSRITDGNTRRFDPVGESWADVVPTVDHPEWRDYLAALATAADERAADLAAELADAPQPWALDALGPVPADDLSARQAWQQRAAVVAGYREMRAHEDDADALGPAPKPGQVEAYAAYRAAWRALGRPEIDLAEYEMSDGQLRGRVRAWEREQTWAPRYVGNELAGTRQAADAQRQTAALRAAEAAAAPDEDERARLGGNARDAAALAELLDERVGQLQQLDDARAEYLAHTAATRAGADVARYLLAERHANDAEPEQRVTADEWLTAERAARAVDDEHRPISEADLVDDIERDTDRATDSTDDVVEVVESDIREVANHEPAPVREDEVRVPTADEVAAALAQANRSITEIKARVALDEHEDAAERVEQLVRWHTDDVQLDDARAVNEDLVYDRGRE